MRLEFIALHIFGTPTICVNNSGSTKETNNFFFYANPKRLVIAWFWLITLINIVTFTAKEHKNECSMPRICLSHNSMNEWATFDLN